MKKCLPKRIFELLCRGGVTYLCFNFFLLWPFLFLPLLLLMANSLHFGHAFCQRKFLLLLGQPKRNVKKSHVLSFCPAAVPKHTCSIDSNSCRLLRIDISSTLSHRSLSTSSLTLSSSYKGSLEPLFLYKACHTQRWRNVVVVVVVRIINKLLWNMCMCCSCIDKQQQHKTHIKQHQQQQHMIIDSSWWRDLVVVGNSACNLAAISFSRLARVTFSALFAAAGRGVSLWKVFKS